MEGVPAGNQSRAWNLGLSHTGRSFLVRYSTIEGGEHGWFARSWLGLAWFTDMSPLRQRDDDKQLWPQAVFGLVWLLCNGTFSICQGSTLDSG